MNHKVTLAVSAALMSMSVHAAADQAAAVKPLNIDATTLQAASPISINKASSPATVLKSRFVREKGLGNTEYTYIVQLEDAPVALYNGGVDGLAATNPMASKQSSVKEGRIGGKLNAKAPAVKAYSNYLQQRQASFESRMTAEVGSLERVATFKFALNGMSVRATQDQAEALSRLPGVKSVEREQVYHLETDRGPTVIGAPAIWDGTVTEGNVGRQGEGIVIGVLDTGVNTDSPSLADVGGDGYDHTNPLGSGVYLGECENNASLCNDKLIGVYSYPGVTDAYADADVFPQNGEIVFGEDYNGHGTHVSGTAGGNVLFNVPEYAPEAGVNASEGVRLGYEFPQVAGVAPHANIISYQVCQPGNPGDPGDTHRGCLGSPMISAVEDAIQSGIVDVINFSISGGGFPWSGTLNEAWLAARNSGIFIAQAAGNDGPDAFTTPKHAPWITAVAASTHGRTVAYSKTISLEGGESEIGPLTGASSSGGYTGPIVYAGNYTNANDPDGDPAQCLQPFPAGTFNGDEIVVCDRGAIARVAKAQNAAAGGAAGFVLANVEGGANSVANDFYVIPGIHIDAASGTELRTWLATGDGHTATISDTQPEAVISQEGTDIIADFSSRGPNGSISTLTPHVAAPGVAIYAAYSDEQYGQDNTGSAPAEFTYLQGTSMASPHVAGAAALVANEKPNWTPDNIRSALMMTATTAMTTQEDGGVADWFDMGSGRINVDLAVQTGLLMDETATNYANANPNEGGDPRTLNIPSITDTNCVGVCTWTRTVTATKAGTWTAGSAAITTGLDITVTPATFTLEAGQSQELTVTIDGFSVPSDVWAFGMVNLTSEGSPDLHMPVSVIPSTGNIPDEFDFDAHRSQDSFLIEDLTAVEITAFTYSSSGLTKATKVEGALAVDSVNGSILDDLTDGVSVTEVTVAEGALRMKAAITETTSPDLDLFLLTDADSDGTPDTIIASSATATAFESIDLMAPEAGTYWLAVQNWAASAEGAEDPFTLAYGVVGATPDADNSLTVTAPAAVPQFDPFNMRFTWDLADGSEGDLYIGVVTMGTDAENATNLGTVPVDVYRDEDDVQVVAVNDDRVVAGDTKAYNVEVLANRTPEAREYTVSLEVPETLNLVEGSVTGGGTVEGSTITWSLTQDSILGVEPSYRITTNQDDANCVNPVVNGINPDGGYVDLELLGIGASTLDGDTVNGTFNVPVNLLGVDYPSVTVTDDGFVTVTGEVGSQPWVNQLMPDATAPNGILAPFWRDGVFDVANGATVSVASNGGSLTIIEWDNITVPWAAYGVTTPFADIADYQIIFRNGVDLDTPHVIFSYDNVTHELGNGLWASVGYENTAGTSGATPIYTARTGGATTGAVESIVDGLQICMYLQPVSSEPAQLGFEVEVTEAAAAGPIQLLAMSSLTAEGTTQVASEVNAEIQIEGAPVPTIGDMTVYAADVLELTDFMLPGAVTEPNGDAYTIDWRQVSGPALVIAGDTLAEAVIQAPEVTEDMAVVLEMTATDALGNSATATANITIKNNQAPTLTVTAPSRIAEGETIVVSASATDPENDTLTYTINGVQGSSYSTSAPGVRGDETLSFEVTVTDGLNTVTDTVTVTVYDTNSGGSMGWMTLLLLPIAFLRRRAK